MWAVLAWDAGDRRAKGRMGCRSSIHRINRPRPARSSSLSDLRVPPRRTLSKSFLGTVCLGADRTQTRRTREKMIIAAFPFKLGGVRRWGARVDDGTAEYFVGGSNGSRRVEGVEYIYEERRRRRRDSFDSSVWFNSTLNTYSSSNSNSTQTTNQSKSVHHCRIKHLDQRLRTNYNLSRPPPRTVDLV